MSARKQIVLRVNAAVKNGAKAAAKKAGISLNEYSERVIARASGVKLESKKA